MTTTEKKTRAVRTWGWISVRVHQTGESWNAVRPCVSVSLMAHAKGSTMAKPTSASAATAGSTRGGCLDRQQPSAEAQERGHQHAVLEVGEDAQLGAHPAHEQHLQEQDQRGKEDEAVRPAGSGWRRAGLGSYPTLPSRLTPSSFCASTANSMGSSLKTSLQKPLTIMLTASSAEIPRCWK